MDSVDYSNPFEVQEKIRRERSAAKARVYASTYQGPTNARIDDAVQKQWDAINRMGSTYNALNGVCRLHVDLLFGDELRKLRWWQGRERRMLKKNEREWKRLKSDELREEARQKKELEW
jgi:hypothetical protein